MRGQGLFTNKPTGTGHSFAPRRDLSLPHDPSPVSKRDIVRRSFQAGGLKRNDCHRQRVDRCEVQFEHAAGQPA